MKDQTLGTMISSLRKQKGMTQAELAQKMNITDKAVSKWERDLSCPDVNSIPKLAEVLGVSVEELMQVKGANKRGEQEKAGKIVELVLKAVALAMGIAVIVTSILKTVDVYSGFTMLGIGLTCLALFQLKKKS